MRLLFSWILLSLILLNVMGYYGVLVSLQKSNTQRLVSDFDQQRHGRHKEIHYKRVVKGHPVQSSNYARVDGEFEQNGNLYRLIRQRIYMDTFHIVYIKDIRGTAINHALKDYVASFASQPTEEDGDDAYVLPLFMKEYCARLFSVQPESLGWIARVHHNPTENRFIPSYFASINHPPNQLS